MGYNWRMSEVNAILGIYQLSRLDEFIAARTKAAQIYDEEFPKINGINTVKLPSNSHSNYYKYCAFLDKGVDKANFKKTLKEKYSVGFSGEVYDVPCHLQPVFKEAFGFKGNEFPKAEDLCPRQVCAPVLGTITEEQARYVVSCVKEVLA
jgi:dTDP-4-amino-4,6-dideoxygalactose transaminase